MSEPTVPLSTPPPSTDPSAETLPFGLDSIAPAASALPTPGQQIGPVRLVSELGRGGMGVVFLGHHTVLDRSVAVKCVPCAGPTRFVEEARAAAAVRHPRLTQIYHADLVPDAAGATAYLVMEYVDGPTLAHVLARAGKLPPAVVVLLMTDIAAAVAELHDHDIVHRDLKPSNVLLDREGNAFVTDFGLAVRKPPTASASAPLTAGTPTYMAPEMFEGRLSPRSDTYALGILMFQLLTGRLPFTGTFEELRQQHESTPLPVELLREQGVDPATIELIERATHKQFMFRHKTAHELLRALRQLPGAGDGARARKELAALILASGGAVGGVAASAGPDSTTVRAEAPPSTMTYAETIARVAAEKRERMRALTTASELEPIELPPQPPPPPLVIPATFTAPSAPEPPQKLEIAIVVCIAVLVILILATFLWWLLSK